MSRRTTIAALYLALVQLLFAISWAIYDIFLPQLTTAAGISKDAASWLSLTDQMLVIVMDISFGLAAPFITKSIKRAGGLIVGCVWFSCLAFLLLPLVSKSSALLLLLVIVWVVTSSAVRLPVMILLSQNVSVYVVGSFAAIVAIGKGLASAFGSYLLSALANTDPKIPFLLSSLSLGLVIFGLRWVLQDEAPAENTEAHQRQPIYLLSLFGGGALLTALGFQLHGGQSAALFLAVEPNVDLNVVMPLFWVGFHLALYPASLLTKRSGAEVALATGAVMSAIGCLSATSALTLPSLIGDQLFTGAGWALFFMAGIALAIKLGAPSKVGLYLASWSALHATATFARMLIARHNLPNTLAPLLWVFGAFLVMLAVILYRRRAP